MDFKTFGNYILLEEFTSTSLGQIHKVLPIKGEPAINYLYIVSEEISSNPQANTIMKTYLNKWLKIKDINILNLIAFEEKESKIAFSFEYVRGRLLSDLVSQCIREGIPLAYDQAVYLISRITDAIVSVSSEDFFYGNINSEMVFVTFEGEVKLLPGVFRDLQTTPLRDKAILEKYIRSYPSDLKEGKSVKEKDQIAFLGALFFELLTREPFEIQGVPFNPEERINEARRGLGFSEGLPENLLKILEKSLLKKENSYKKVEEFKADIDELIATGEYSPSTFNTAFLIHTLFRDQDEIEAKKDEEYLKIDRKLYEPKKEKKQIVIPPPKVEEEKPLTFGIEEEPKEGKRGLIIAIALSSLVIVGILFGIFFSKGKKGEEDKAEIEKMKQLEEQNRQLKEQIEKLMAEVKAKEDAILKAQTPEQKIQAQKELEETRKKLLETQKLQEESQQALITTKEIKKEEKKEQIEVAKSEPSPQVPQVSQSEVKTQQNEPKKEEIPEIKEIPKSVPSEQPQSQPQQIIKQGDFVEYFNLDVPPQIVYEEKPEYPPLARQHKVEGRVYVKVEIDENGFVINAQVVRSPEPDYGLKEASLKAAKKTKFSPPLKNNVRVKTSYTLNYLFTLKGSK